MDFAGVEVPLGHILSLSVLLPPSTRGLAVELGFAGDMILLGYSSLPFPSDAKGRPF